MHELYSSIILKYAYATEYWFKSQHALDDTIDCSKNRTRNNLPLSFCKYQKLNFVLLHINFLLLIPD